MTATVKRFRENLKTTVGRCEICGKDHYRYVPGCQSFRLDVHEIARGVNREKALDKPYALLVLCAACHIQRIHGNEDWPEARQLAVLKRSRPGDYDLAKYNALVGYGPQRITEEDVDVWATP